MLSRAHMRIVGAVCAAAALMLVAGGCTVSTGDNTGSSSSAVTTTPTSEALVTVTPADGGTPVSPLDPPIEVQVAKGTLTTVALTNPEGKEVAGITTPDKTSWKPSEPLGYGKTYKLVVDAVDANGVATTKNTTLTTVAPSNQTRAYINTTGGASISDGGTYGVGTVVAVHFDELIGDKAAAEKSLLVTTNPPYRDRGTGSTVRTFTGDRRTTTHQARRSR